MIEDLEEEFFVRTGSSTSATSLLPNFQVTSYIAAAGSTIGWRLIACTSDTAARKGGRRRALVVCDQERRPEGDR